MSQTTPAEVQARSGPVLGVFAHPDDAEISCGGTLAKWASAGRETHLLLLTAGDRGSGDASQDRAELATIRRAEAERAAGVLGLAGVRVLDTPDGELENTLAIRASVARRIRGLRPETVISLDPTTWFMDNVYFNHADHRRVGEIALDALFPGAGNPHFFAEQLAEGLEPWSVTDVWLGWSNEPNHREDVSDTFRRKLDALAEHTSQVKGGMLGYFEEELHRDAKAEGEQSGVAFAEAFRVLSLDE